jgi:hypothetical protein
MRLVSPLAGLAAAFAVSLLWAFTIGAPFTLQYARERVPKEYWASPLFLATNQRITGVWGAAFAVMTIADAAAEYIEAIPLWIEIAATISAFVAAVWFTQWYPAVVRDAKAAGRTQRQPRTAQNVPVIYW